MNRLKGKVEKLESAREPELPIILIMPGKEPTEEDLLKIAKAEAAGIKPIIVRFGVAKRPEVNNETTI